MQAGFRIYPHMLLPFFLCSDGKSLRYLILNVHATPCSYKRNYSSHIKDKTVGLKRGSIKQKG